MSVEVQSFPFSFDVVALYTILSFELSVDIFVNLSLLPVSLALELMFHVY